MQKSQFKHKEGAVIETTAGTFGKIVSAKVVYEVAFGPNEIKLVDEDVIVTEPAKKRERKPKEEETIKGQGYVDIVDNH